MRINLLPDYCETAIEFAIGSNNISENSFAELTQVSKERNLEKLQAIITANGSTEMQLARYCLFLRQSIRGLSDHFVSACITGPAFIFFFLSFSIYTFRFRQDLNFLYKRGLYRCDRKEKKDGARLYNELTEAPV